MSKPPLADSWITQRLKGHYHRQLVLISGDQPWAIEQARAIQQQFSDNVLWVGEHPEGIGADCGDYRQYLGREYELLIYNVYSGIRANALMALSGTVTHSGLMLLLCPDLTCWPDMPDPQATKRVSFGFKQDDTRLLFVEWLLRQAETDPQVLLLTPEGQWGCPAPAKSPRPPGTGPFATEDQQYAVEAIVKVATGHRNRPLVITADRGRGKSSALGIAATQIIERTGKKILITAPTLAQTQKVFEHAKQHMTVSEQTPSHLISATGGSLLFQPVDQIIKTRTAADMLLVDEAAAIPAPLLKTLTTRYSRIVFSSTVHGYEGCGRGFELRFKPALASLHPQYRQVKLEQPVRWQSGDSLERFWFNITLMDSPATTHGGETLIGETLSFVPVAAQQLIQQPDLFRQVFQLLINAHYQTSPDDLMRLLDAPQSRLFVLAQADQVVAAVLADEEGGAPLHPLAEEISQGTRRVQGHLLAQNLSHWVSSAALARLRYLRIVRIAVSPSLWGKGLGSRCLNELYDVAKAQQIDFIGSAFGLTAELASFWLKNQFYFSRLGLKQDMTSGEHSMLVLRPLSESATTAMSEIRHEFQREFVTQLPGPFRQVPGDVVRGILQTFSGQDTLEASDLTRLRRFAKGMGTAEAIFVSLRQCCLWLCQHQQLQDDVRLHLLIAMTLQYHHAAQLCETFNLKGKRDITRALRQLLEEKIIFNDNNIKLK
ncbi:GNAT family N-acetyltransferase [Lacimicrobium sp. SS2-24]|uniref:tRNA(Met) cytidine acetyltransferase TmcA n=1 Tax=Lacimicrobium sp. SS2-24 TaxID=2005569 RepID=UPI000B4AF6CA|nr:GNAT family N-acetyltransferase [Lacimicrobium sp. SS2-24]